MFCMIYSCPGKIDTVKIDTFYKICRDFKTSILGQKFFEKFPERLTHFPIFDGTKNVSIFPGQLYQNISYIDAEPTKASNRQVRRVL